MTDSNDASPSSLVMAAATSTLGSITSTQTDVPYDPSDGTGSATSRQSTVFSITLIFLVLSFVSVALRVIARAGIVRKMRPDDWTIVVAWLLSFCMCFAICLGTRNGFGRHLEDIPTAWRPTKQKCRYAFTILYNPAIVVTKVSILIFYLLVFKVQRLFRVFCYVTLTVLVTTGLALTFLLGFACHPISLAWKASLPPPQYCFNTISIYYASAPVNILTDLAIIVLPIPVLTSLRLPPRQKAILIIVFGLGVFVLIVGIVRVYYFQLAAASTTTSAEGVATNDFDYQAALSFMWAALEVNVGIICASVPMTKPLIHRFFPSWLGGTTNGRTAVENGTVLDYNSRDDREAGRQMSIAQALAPPGTSRPRWLSASGGMGGVVGELGNVDSDGHIGASSAQMAYSANYIPTYTREVHLQVPARHEADEISLTESELKYIGDDGKRKRMYEDDEKEHASASTSATATEKPHKDSTSDDEILPVQPPQQPPEAHIPPWERMDIEFMS